MIRRFCLTKAAHCRCATRASRWSASNRLPPGYRPGVLPGELQRQDLVDRRPGVEPGPLLGIGVVTLFQRPVPGQEVEQESFVLPLHHRRSNWSQGWATIPRTPDYGSGALPAELPCETGGDALASCTSRVGRRRPRLSPSPSNWSDSQESNLEPRVFTVTHVLRPCYHGK